MSQNRKFDLVQYLRFLVADFAVWFCGCPTLFWTAPEEWEEYMSIGEPYVKPEN